jgi:hypothetical protein
LRTDMLQNAQKRIKYGKYVASDFGGVLARTPHPASI